MNKLKQLSLIALLVAVTTSLSFAQSFDADRMNRDITIMENVLAELFKIDRINTSSNRVFVSGSSSAVKGAYLPEYGVIFLVPAFQVVRVSSESNEKPTLTFYYGDEDESEVNEENVIKRSKEFIRDYASTIGQLKPSEKVMIIYGATSSRYRSSSFNFSFSFDNRRSSEKESLPIISMVAETKDINDYKAGKINQQAFNNKISVAKNTKKELLDLKVLGNIFETALDEGDNYEFHLVNSNSIGSLYLENFGAIYTMNLHRGHKFRGTVVDLRGRVSQSSVALSEYTDKIKENEAEMGKMLKDEYAKLISRMKEYIVDYGRTLRSIKDDQHLLVTVNLNERQEGIPNRVDFQIKKSTLNQLDRGSINRDAAMNQIIVTEY